MEVNHIKEMDSLWELLNRGYVNKPQIISVVGAGGKTSIITRIAGELQSKRIQAIVTTTTKMYQPTADCFIADFPIIMENNDKICEGNILSSQSGLILSKIKESLEKYTVVWVGTPISNNKITSPSIEVLAQLMRLDIPIIIEADGAKRLPCKVPAEHEPVIKKETDLVIGVYGVDCIGKSIREICHRPQLAAKLLCTNLEHILTCEDVVELVISKLGLQKNILSSMDFYFILNKVHTDADLRLAARIGELLSKKEFNKFIIM